MKNFFSITLLLLMFAGNAFADTHGCNPGMGESGCAPFIGDLSGKLNAVKVATSDFKYIESEVLSAMYWDVVVYDAYGYRDTSLGEAHKLTVAPGIEYVRISGSLTWHDNPIGNRLTYLFHYSEDHSLAEGTVGYRIIRSQAAIPDVAMQQSFDSGIIAVNPGDYFVMNVYQDSGVPLPIWGGGNFAPFTWFSLEVIHP